MSTSLLDRLQEQQVLINTTGRKVACHLMSYSQST